MKARASRAQNCVKMMTLSAERNRKQIRERKKIEFRRARMGNEHPPSASPNRNRFINQNEISEHKIIDCVGELSVAPKTGSPFVPSTCTEKFNFSVFADDSIQSAGRRRTLNRTFCRSSRQGFGAKPVEIFATRINPRTHL